MHRRTVLRKGTLGLAAGGVAGLGGCSVAEGDPRFSEGFEAGADGWETGAHIGPEEDVADFEWEIGVSGEQAATGEQSLRLFTEGDHDDGTCWAVHSVPVESGAAVEATVTASFWSESESFNVLRNAVVRLGPEPPESEADFPSPGVNTTALEETPYGGLREPLHLSEGWREYRFGWTSPELSTDALYVAVGTSVIWEADTTHFVDGVTVEIEPQ